MGKEYSSNQMKGVNVTVVPLATRYLSLVTHHSVLVTEPVTPSILLLRLSSLGDIVLTTPLIAAIRERYPDSRIDLVISDQYETLVPVLPGLSRVHLFHKRTGRRGL